MTAKRLTFEEMEREYEEFAAREWGPDDRVFYDGLMEPWLRWCQQEQDIMIERIEAAGGIEAWRALHSKDKAKDKQAA